MDREAMDALRYDRRLAHRRGWVPAEELAQVEQGADDASPKATTLGEAADDAEAAAAAAPVPEAPEVPAPDPIAAPGPPGPEAADPEGTRF